MKFLSTFLVLSFAFRQATAADMLPQLINVAQRTYRSMLEDHYEKSVELSLKSVESILANASSAHLRFEKIKTHACERLKQSTFCKLASGLENVSKSCVHELGEFLVEDGNAKLMSMTLDAYVDKVSELIKEKMSPFKDQISSTNVNCLMNKFMDNSDMALETIQSGLKDHLEETLDDYNEQMDAYREGILDYTRKVSTTYRECIVAADVECLENYVKLDDNANLPFRYRILSEQITELIQEQLAVVGPEMTVIVENFNQYSGMIESILKACKDEKNSK